MAVVPQLDLRPPAEPLLRPDGRVSLAWLAYFEALADRLVAAETLLATINATYVRVA